MQAQDTDDAQAGERGLALRDSDIRRELDALLRLRHGNDPDTLIRHEVGLCAGKRRIDVAIVNGELAGYEIKSDEDTLLRLEGQAAAYGQVLDRAVIVTTDRHLDHALDDLPEWWGVIVARKGPDGVILETIREPERNDQHDPFALSQLLWRDEVLEELRARGLAKGLSNKARHYAWLALAALPMDELRDLVRARLKARQDWPGGQLRELCDAKLPTVPIP